MVVAPFHEWLGFVDGLRLDGPAVDFHTLVSYPRVLVGRADVALIVVSVFFINDLAQRGQVAVVLPKALRLEYR